MDRLGLVRVALAELGEASSEELAAFVQARHGVKLDVRYVPVMRETLKQLEARAAFYRERAMAVAVSEETVTADKESKDEEAVPG